MKTLIDDDACCLAFNPSSLEGSDRLLVVFAGVGSGPVNRDSQGHQFYKTASARGGYVSVADRRRSWGNYLDATRISSHIIALANGRPIYTIGNSMGAFLAILFSTQLKAERTLALAPQWTVQPRLMPQEGRWRHFTKQIDRWWYPSLDGAFNDATKYVTINGDTPKEQRHWSRFPLKRNVQHYVLNGVDHEVGAFLKSSGELNDCLDHSLFGQWEVGLIAGHKLRSRAYRLQPKMAKVAS